jgi:hypothetical protein
LPLECPLASPSAGHCGAASELLNGLRGMALRGQAQRSASAHAGLWREARACAAAAPLRLGRAASPLHSVQRGGAPVRRARAARPALRRGAGTWCSLLARQACARKAARQARVSRAPRLHGRQARGRLAAEA